MWKVPAQLGVDEKAFAKRHQYVTLVCDLETKSEVRLSQPHALPLSTSTVAASTSILDPNMLGATHSNPG